MANKRIKREIGGMLATFVVLYIVLFHNSFQLFSPIFSLESSLVFPYLVSGPVPVSLSSLCYSFLSMSSVSRFSSFLFSSHLYIHPLYYSWSKGGKFNRASLRNAESTLVPLLWQPADPCCLGFYFK